MEFDTIQKLFSGRYCKRKRINVFSRFRARTSHESNSSRKIYAENESSFQNITNLPPFSLFLYFCSRYFFIFKDYEKYLFYFYRAFKMSNDEYARKKASLENLPKFNEDMKDRYDQVKAFFHNVILIQFIIKIKNSNLSISN